MAAFATPAQMLQVYDARIVGDLVADDDTRVSAAGLLSDAVLAAVLVRASGQIEAALRASNRYSVDDLEDLAGNNAGHLVQMTCDIAMSLLFSRRPGAEWAEQRAAFEQVKDTHLERLRNGENIFDLTDHAEAGLPDLAIPSLVDIRQRNGMRDSVSYFFPARRIPRW